MSIKEAATLIEKHGSSLAINSYYAFVLQFASNIQKDLKIKVRYNGQKVAKINKQQSN